MGNFITRVKSKGRVRDIQHGAAIIATGADEYKPREYLYGDDARVMTQLELEEQISRRDERLINSQSLVMIQCVGCRQEDRNYCSRICCSAAMKNALKLRSVNRQMDIYVLFRDMRTYGFREDYYLEASNKDVKFIRYEPHDKPQVEAVEEDGRSFLRVTVSDPVLGKKLAIDADSVALAAAVIPSAGSRGNSPIVQGASEPGWVLPGSSCEIEAGRFCRGRRLSVWDGAVSQASVGNDQPGLWSGRPGPDASFP